ncbi:MAG: ribonuclease III [Candidatus Zixiibacteriota bacterium]
MKNLFAPRPRTPEESLREVQQIIGFQFRDESLLRTALTHRSFSNTCTEDIACNERLEFLGDTVLDLIISEQLFREHPEMQEGQLTQTKSLLVNETTLADVGHDTRINEHLFLAPEEVRTGGRERASIIADAVESIIAAVYLDGGLDAARDVVLRLLYSRKEDIIMDASRRNFKGELLELVQAHTQGLPRYDVVSEEGPDHEKIFHVEVYIGNTRFGHGSGNSKKEAEQNAAAMALKRYQNSCE